MLFILGCIPVRLGLTYLAKSHLQLLTPLGLLFLAIGIGMAAIYLFDLRPTGVEAGGRIWWNNVRPVHSALYLTFAYLALTGSTNAWMVLLADTLFGLGVHTVHYWGT
jgi:hypothetical protein